MGKGRNLDHERSNTHVRLYRQQQLQLQRQGQWGVSLTERRGSAVSVLEGSLAAACSREVHARRALLRKGRATIAIHCSRQGSRPSRPSRHPCLPQLPHSTAGWLGPKAGSHPGDRGRLPCMR